MAAQRLSELLRAAGFPEDRYESYAAWLARESGEVPGVVSLPPLPPPRQMVEWAGGPYRAGLFDPVANARAALTYLEARYGSEPSWVTATRTGWYSVRWVAPPWWARAAAWAIAIYYAVRR